MPDSPISTWAVSGGRHSFMRLPTGLMLLVLASATIHAAPMERRVAAEIFQLLPGVPTGGVPTTFTPTSNMVLDHYEAARREFDQSVLALGSIPVNERTFEKTIEAIDRIQARLNERVQWPFALSFLSPDPDVRGATSGHSIPVLWANPTVIRALTEYVGSSGSQVLSESQARLLEQMKLESQSNGGGLSAEDAQLLQNNRIRLSNMEIWARLNVWDDVGTVPADRSEIVGLPGHLLDQFPESSDNLRYFSATEPYPFDVLMEHAEDPEFRRRLLLANVGKGASYNVGYIQEALTLRATQARLLQSPSYAEVAMSGRSIESPGGIARFLRRIRRVLRPAVQREDAQLLALKKIDYPEATDLNSWDIPYYTRLLRQNSGFDETQAKKYFPAERTISAVLDRLGPAFGVRFQEKIDSPSWHPSVKFFAIEDLNGIRLASFYLDAFEREGKIGGRYVEPLVRGRALPDGSYREPASIVVLNFQQSTNGNPGQLNHSELVGLLHELGHLLDNALTEARYERFSGGTFGPGLDRSEMPSQMIEQMAWDPAFLRSISVGGDGSQIPDEVLSGMLANANLGRARTIMTWAARAAIDLALHSTLKPPMDVAALIDRIFEMFGLPLLPTGHSYQSSFLHLMGPYAAGYYTYLQTLNYALQIFDHFQSQGGLDSPEAGYNYRRYILGPGGGVATEKAVGSFLGRPPDPHALEKFARTLR